MIKYNITCEKCNSIFDSWFARSDKFELLKKKRLITCPQCNSTKISKSIMAPSVFNNKEVLKSNKLNQDIKKKIFEYQKFVKENFEYVGKNFAHEARNIFYDKKKTKGIYGNATNEELEELNEEGIETTTLPWFRNTEN